MRIRHRGRDGRSHKIVWFFGGSGDIRRDCLLALVLVLLCILTAFVQPASADNNKIVQLGSVVVTDTGLPAPLQIQPGNTTRLDSASLNLLDATQPAQLFSVVPGGWVTEGSGQESLMSIRSPLLTGAGACGAFLLLEDGIPIQPAGFCNVNAMFWLNTEQSHAMEVIRGPGSARYGSNALNGVVNVLTQPANAAQPDNTSLEFGVHDYRRAEAGIGTTDGNRGLRVVANATHDGGFRAASGYDQQKLMLRLDYDDGRVSRENLLSATNLNQKTAGYIYGASAYKDESLRDSNPQAGAFRDAQSWLAAQKWRIQLDDGNEFDFTPYARRNRLDFTEHYLPGTPIEHDAVNSTGAMLALRTSLGDATHLTYGLDTEYAHGSMNEFQPAAVTTQPPAQADIRPQGLHYDYAADSRTLAAYVHVQHALNTRWLLTGGLRAETVRYSYVNYLPVGNTRADGTACPFGGCLFNRPADRSDQFANLLPKLGMSWLVSNRQTLYFNLRRGARAPQASELYQLQRQQSVADLQPEVVNSFESGWRGEAGRLQWDADVYAMQKTHSIFRDSDGFIVSNGRIRSHGLEFSLGYHFNQHWELLANGSYAVHQYAFAANAGPTTSIAYGNEVKYAPRSLGGLRLRWQPAESLTAELQWSHVGGYFLDEANLHRYGGQDLLNLSMDWHVADGWTLATRITNLADTAYAERADYSFGNYRYFPGDGREWFVRIGKTF